MATHYSPSPDTIACGRTGASLESAADLSQVTCKLCIRAAEKAAAEPVRKTPTLAELRAAAKAKKAAASEDGQGVAAVVSEPKPVAPAPAAKPAAAKPAASKPQPAPQAELAPKAAAALSPRAAWQQRLQQLPGRNRLPRGAARQTFI